MKSKIAIIGQDKTCILTIADVYYIHSQGDQGTLIYFTDNTSLFTTYRFKRFIEGLCSHTFCKTHQSYLVNLMHIQEIKKDYTKLTNGKKIPIVNGYYNKLLNKFHQI